MAKRKPELTPNQAFQSIVKLSDYDQGCLLDLCLSDPDPGVFTRLIQECDRTTKEALDGIKKLAPLAETGSRCKNGGAKGGNRKKLKTTEVERRQGEWQKLFDHEIGKDGTISKTAAAKLAARQVKVSYKTLLAFVTDSRKQ